MARKKKKKKGIFLMATFKAFFILAMAVLFIWVMVKINGDYSLVINTTSQTTVSTEATSKSTEPATTTRRTRSTTLATTSTTTTTTTKPSTTADASQYAEYENRMVSWSFKRNKNHKPVIGYNEGIDIGEFGGYYIGDTSSKVVYLTFDEGYENGYTDMILDTLKKNDVKAAFFVTKAYVDDVPAKVKRMKDEGHIVGNHSATHPDLTTKTYDEFVDELESTRKAMEKASGYKMDMFFRPPQGKFSERTMYFADSLGYKTIFWSMAYKDWLRDAQPGKDVAFKHVTDNVHPGALILLHAVSQSNAEALDDIIKELKAMGYRFASLEELK